MGHKTGKGLGKYGQGRVNIVEASMQRGRRGLGMTVNGFEPSHLEWDIEKEVVSCLSRHTEIYVSGYNQ